MNSKIVLFTKLLGCWGILMEIKFLHQRKMMKMNGVKRKRIQLGKRLNHKKKMRIRNLLQGEGEDVQQGLKNKNNSPQIRERKKMIPKMMKKKKVRRIKIKFQRIGIQMEKKITLEKKRSKKCKNKMMKVKMMKVKMMKVKMILVG